MKSTRKKITKKAIRQPDFAPRELTQEEQIAVEAFDRTGDNLGNAVCLFWRGWGFAQPFLKTAIDTAMMRASALFGIANPADEDDPVKQLEKLRTLYEVTGADFKLRSELTAADHLFAVLNDHDALDDIPQDLFDLLCDYFEGKIKAAEHSALYPDSVGLPSVKMVLAAGVASDRERETGEIKGTPAKTASPALKWSHGDTNEAIAGKHPSYGQAAFNIYYSVDQLPPMMRDAFSDTLSDLAKKLDVPDPTDTRGEVEGFKRLIKVCKAAAEQESKAAQE